MRWAPRATLCSPSHRAVQSVVSGHQDSTSKPLVIPLYIICMQLFASRASSRCKHDVCALSWLNVETVKRAPTPLFGRLVRCYTHGPFFERLWYIIHIGCSTWCINNSNISLTDQHEVKGRMLFCLGNVTYFLDVTLLFHFLLQWNPA